MFCLKCGLPVHNKLAKYCSNKCQREYEYDCFIRDWKLGKRKYGKPIRTYLFEKFDSKCFRCGWCEINLTTGLIPLEVEHIDGNSDNDKEENLILICPNCHSLTPTYRSLNKGNGRHKRRQRYLEGKSY